MMPFVKVAHANDDTIDWMLDLNPVANFSIVALYVAKLLDANLLRVRNLNRYSVIGMSSARKP